MADRELLLRCACGVEHVDIDVWFRTDEVDEPLETQTDPRRRELDEGYMTIYSGWRERRPFKSRLHAAVALLRDRDQLLEAIILKPEDVKRMTQFFAALREATK